MVSTMTALIPGTVSFAWAFSSRGTTARSWRFPQRKAMALRLAGSGADSSSASRTRCTSGMFSCSSATCSSPSVGRSGWPVLSSRGWSARSTSVPASFRMSSVSPFHRYRAPSFRACSTPFEAGSARSRSWSSAGRCVAGVVRSVIRAWGSAASARPAPKALRASQQPRSTRHVVRMTSYLNVVSPLPAGEGSLTDELPTSPLFLVRQPGALAVHHVKAPLAIPTPVAGAPRIGQLTPGLWSYPFFGLPDHIKLAIFLDLANIHRLPGVMILFVNLVLPYRTINFQPLQRLEHFIDVRRTSFFYRFCPQMHVDIGVHHGIVSDALLVSNVMLGTP